MIGLVTGSVGRTEPLRRLATSLLAQTMTDYFLVVVEQTDVESVTQLIQSILPRDKCTVIPSARGLSNARNAGVHYLSQISRDLVIDFLGFPDDDCWYEPGTLQAVKEAFVEAPDIGFLNGAVLTSDGEMLRFPKEDCLITRTNVWRSVVSPGLFFRADVAHGVGAFDPNLGVGTTSGYGSGEETDFVLRALDAGHKGRFTRKVAVHHPPPSARPGRLTAMVGVSYGRGMGYVLGQNGYSGPVLLWHVLRPLAGAGLALAKGQRDLARFRLAVGQGRALGALEGRRR